MEKPTTRRAESGPEYAGVALEINSMAKVDQEMRIRNLRESEHWDDSIDRGNTARMKEIVKQIGWPTISKVGEIASNNAWLLTQHADHDVEFQKECLVLMKSQPSGEVNLENIAMLEDRTRVNSGQPQLYGSQFRELDGEIVPAPIEDEARVDERRKSMGLNTLAENIAVMKGKYPPQEQE